eukprot:GHVN01085020.1.p1 GENE.GHVN01085020.1~~GHVN01085020.1.p1  ORF type:complete len:115 (-),score=22.09 GHVN01085020.1:487-831(-)
MNQHLAASLFSSLVIMKIKSKRLLDKPSHSLMGETLPPAYARMEVTGEVPHSRTRSERKQSPVSSTSHIDTHNHDNNLLSLLGLDRLCRPCQKAVDEAHIEDDKVKKRVLVSKC